MYSVVQHIKNQTSVVSTLMWMQHRLSCRCLMKAVRLSITNDAIMWCQPVMLHQANNRKVFFFNAKEKVIGLTGRLG